MGRGERLRKLSSSRLSLWYFLLCSGCSHPTIVRNLTCRQLLEYNISQALLRFSTNRKVVEYVFSSIIYSVQKHWKRIANLWTETFSALAGVRKLIQWAFLLNAAVSWALCEVNFSDGAPPNKNLSPDRSIPHISAPSAECLGLAPHGPILPFLRQRHLSTKRSVSRSAPILNRQTFIFRVHGLFQLAPSSDCNAYNLLLFNQLCLFTSLNQFSFVAGIPNRSTSVARFRKSVCFEHD